MALLTIATSFPQVLEHHGKHPKTRAFTFATVWSELSGVQQRLSFGDFWLAVRRGATAYSTLVQGNGLALSAGDRIAFLSKGNLDFYIALVSAQLVGLTPSLLNWRQPCSTLVDMVRDVKAAVIAISMPYHTEGMELAKVLSLEVLAISIDSAGEGTLPQWSWRFSTPVFSITEQPSLKTEAAIFYTSGSTRRPKPVVHTYGTLLWTAKNFVFPTTKMATTLCFLPNFHVLMTFQNFLLPLARGIGVSIHGADATEFITARLLLAAAACLAPTTIDTVPFIMNEWSNMSCDELAPLSRCAAVRSGGCPLSVAVATRLMDAGVKLQVHYGQTEAPGMQLLTVPGAQCDELGVLYPPWPCVEMKLDGNEGEGELLIRGCRGSSPGYLKNGVLDRASSKVDAFGWHHSGDIFRYVRTRSGVLGVTHVSRVDEVILLVTGEQFNPVQIEKAVAEYISRMKPCLRASGLIVLGRGQVSPFLVIELDALEARSADAVVNDIWPGIELANARAVHYARIKKSHVLVLKGTSNPERLPRSAKGNIIRSCAETQLAPILTRIAEDSRASEQLRRLARDAVYDNELQCKIANKQQGGLFSIGVDSLGITALVSRPLTEAERIGDNVKAWMITSVVMVHWYDAKAGALGMFYYAQDPKYAMYNAVSKPVQFFVSAATFSNGVLDTSACILTIVFSIGLADAERDHDRRVRLGARECTMVMLIFFYKLVLFAEQTAATKVSWSPKNLKFSDGPTNVLWFVYMLLYARIATLVLQRIRVDARLMLICAFALIIVTNTTGNNHSCQYCSLPSLGSKFRGIENVFNFLFYDNAALVWKSSLRGGKEESFTVVSEILPMNLARSACSFVFVSSKSRITILEQKYIVFFPAYILGYFFGRGITDASRRFVSCLQKCFQQKKSPLSLQAAITCGGLAYGCFCIYEALLFSWLADNSPSLKVPRLVDIPTLPSADWIWSSTKGRPCLRNWSPISARPVYFLLHWTAEYTVAFLCLSACIALPWRAARCGNSALGKFFFIWVWPTVQSIWLLWLASKVGLALGPTSVCAGLIQFFLLLVWPFVFVYTIGPILTAVTVAEPRFLRWLGRVCCKPLHAIREAQSTLRSLPTTAVSWWSNYFFEIRRDVACTADFFSGACGTVLGKMKSLGHALFAEYDTAVAKPLLESDASLTARKTNTYGAAATQPCADIV